MPAKHGTDTRSLGCPLQLNLQVFYWIDQWSCAGCAKLTYRNWEWWFKVKILFHILWEMLFVSTVYIVVFRFTMTWKTTDNHLLASKLIIWRFLVQQFLCNQCHPVTTSNLQEPPTTFFPSNRCFVSCSIWQLLGKVFFIIIFLPLVDSGTVERVSEGEDIHQRATGWTQTWVACSPSELNCHLLLGNVHMTSKPK